MAVRTSNRGARRRTLPLADLVIDCPPLEPTSPLKLDCREGAVSSELVRPYAQIAHIASHEVPGICGELVTDRIDKSRWPIQVEYLIAPEHEPEEVVET
jgi:hypothetical protein